MKVCLKCGQPNKADATNCHYCGSVFAVAESNLEEISANASELTKPADVVCMYCGALNPGGIKNCRTCQAVLVQADFSVNDRHVIERTGVFDRAQEAVNGLRKGSLSREDFTQWVEEFGAKLTEQAQELTELIKETGYFEANPEEVEMGMTGVFDYLEGIDLLRLYLAENQGDLLEQALGKMWEGNLKINESLKINREFVQELRQDLGQEI